MKDQKISPISVLDQSPMFVCGVMQRMYRNRAQAELSRQNLMTLEMASALAALEEFQPMSQQALADAVRTERSVAKRMVDNLEKRGFVQVSKSKSNQRLKMLSMTKEGANALKQVHQIMTNLQKEFFSCLSESEVSEFFRLVRKLTFANHDQ
ncbi:MarR family transcriptional regulator [Vibrio alginolyticus]|uniref:MarR family winged helix-turn-helix transcriptional regulator n=1 Tax=Vibrio TaxID=662 RepID=UPI001EEEDCD0|nr:MULTISPECIES: MarR family transcriptional regulator [Vibrio]ELB2828468.1 MarR family transcriptional regulator [Vibrio alginolyticus]ELB2833647.1 MarR family transcriptional regulator [Vibrio alginolyticus]EMC2459347.1 MarR family transcriptional regulator [Vibrio alginolyticus]MCR9591250.1 MarR family transcriptional regulator [Vibrio alginolyticus]MCS0298852.1 MarR family transcriptional regulator [Vibrio alginolyticus]